MRISREVIDNPKIGDECYSIYLGYHDGGRMLIWCACPRCKSERWARKYLVNSLCLKCNQKDIKQREKISKGTKESYEYNTNLKQIRVEQMLGIKRDWSPTDDHVNKIKLALTGKKQTLEHVEKVRKATKLSWMNPEVKDKRIKGWVKAVRVKPNKAERKLNLIIQKISKRKFALNVKGNIMILGGKIPDFVNINGKKNVIELYGDYFHKGENPDDRIDYFKKFGYETLIIWERELKNEPILIQKVSNWMNDNA